MRQRVVRTKERAATKNINESAISASASCAEVPRSVNARTTPSTKYASISIDDHLNVYRLPRKTPDNAAISGSTLIASQEPPGRSGASQNSHERHSSTSANKHTLAVTRAARAFIPGARALAPSRQAGVPAQGKFSFRVRSPVGRWKRPRRDLRRMEYRRSKSSLHRARCTAFQQ